MKKILFFIAISIIALSCSKGGGTNGVTPPPPPPPPTSTVSTVELKTNTTTSVKVGETFAITYTFVVAKKGQINQMGAWLYDSDNEELHTGGAKVTTVKAVLKKDGVEVKSYELLNAPADPQDKTINDGLSAGTYDLTISGVADQADLFRIYLYMSYKNEGATAGFQVQTKDKQAPFSKDIKITD